MYPTEYRCPTPMSGGCRFNIPVRNRWGAASVGRTIPESDSPGVLAALAEGHEFSVKKREVLSAFPKTAPTSNGKRIAWHGRCCCSDHPGRPGPASTCEYRPREQTPQGMSVPIPRIAYDGQLTGVHPVLFSGPVEEGNSQRSCCKFQAERFGLDLRIGPSGVKPMFEGQAGGGRIHTAGIRR